jgi:hypothetical protein
MQLNGPDVANYFMPFGFAAETIADKQALPTYVTIQLAQ